MSSNRELLLRDWASPLLKDVACTRRLQCRSGSREWFDLALSWWSIDCFFFDMWQIYVGNSLSNNIGCLG